MPTYKQVVNHVKKHVLWKEEYFERYYRLNPELVQKRLDKIYQAEDDLMVLISTQLFCFLQANGTLYFDSCYKTGKADNSLLCTNLALWSIGLADLSVKLATDGYQRGHDYGCSCQVVRVGDNVSAAGCNGVA